MSTTPLVSVVMSTYNAQPFLGEAVRSILDQSFRNFEFIIVNDGSTDGSASELESFEHSDPRVRLYHQENTGYVEALNKACALAKGKYIARMDADDVALKDRLLWQVDFLDGHPEVALLGGAIELIDPSGKPLRTVRHAIHDDGIRSAFSRGEVAMSHPTVVFRKEAFLATGGFRKCLMPAEDYDLWLRMSERSEVANLEKVVLRYRLHPDQISLRKRRQQTLSSLAAQAAATARRQGLEDPLDSTDRIDEATLARLGVSQSLLETTLARHYLGWIRTLAEGGQDSRALALADEMFSYSDWKNAERWTVADALLARSGIYWKQRRFFPALLSAFKAVARRPVLLGRPFKPLLFRASPVS